MNRKGVFNDPHGILSSYMGNVVATSADRRIIVASLEFASESTSWDTHFIRSIDGGLSWSYLSELRKPSYMSVVDTFTPFDAEAPTAVFVDLDLGGGRITLLAARWTVLLFQPRRWEILGSAFPPTKK